MIMYRNFRFANRAFTLEAFAGSQEIDQFTWQTARKSLPVI
jgi:hypothetical protein